MTSGKQQVHKGRGKHKIGGNGRHLQKATSCSGWTKPPSNQNKIRDMQYDKFCPKVSNEDKARTCPKCALYFPSVASMKRHKKSVHQKAGAANEDEEVLHVSDEHLFVLMMKMERKR
ncbi:hypothetical protein PoB_000899400 [Plakobranchus ocellatus]|uniref:C2H2-type domain-containing protein n=1 Tax=Plakobranchus ocellatus TaxID=259542 RepID=A0AAV3YJM6_9GAST|nr:hypothetical protein PoB_000899400 [Plakobranchus ocellatus]